jgi:NAD-dependent deacetylase
VPYDLEAELDAAERCLRDATHTIALVGAGISAESGIPTFRGPGGLWTRFGEPEMNGFQRFLADPVTWWQDSLRRRADFDELRASIDSAVPNPGHLAMADLERMGRLRHIITQNIDNLHQVAGSTAITEIHGNRYKLRCLNCGARYPHDAIQLEPLPPRCPECQGIVKSDTVMFGEPIPVDALDECYRQAEMADCILLVGTSAQVYPAAEFPLIVKRRGGVLVEVNPMETAATDSCDVVLRAPAGQALPRLVERLKSAG